MAARLQHIATLAFNRRRAFLAAWLLIIVAALGFHAVVGSAINSDFTIPGSSSQKALDQLQKTLPAAAGTSAQIVFESPAGTKITDARYRRGVEATLDQARRAPQVAAVVDPFTTKAVSRNGRSALASIEYTVTRAHLDSDSLPALETATKPAQRAGLIAHVGGSAYGSVSSSSGASAGIGVVIAFVILFITFGSLVAAGCRY
jgi:RND superfamily putative drug exporter